MSESAEPHHQDPDFTKAKEVNTKPSDVDDFRAENKERKLELFRNLAKGAAIGTGKEIAKQFIEWLTDN